jgi:hypothetical protein
MTRAAKRTPLVHVPSPCPIPHCRHEFDNGIRGWDGHVKPLRNHPQWHPEVEDPEQRKVLFQKEYPHFWDQATTPSKRVSPPNRPGARAAAPRGSSSVVPRLTTTYAAAPMPTAGPVPLTCPTCGAPLGYRP